VGLVGGYDAFDGLRRALSLYGSEQWDVMTARALRLQEQPDPSGFNFALDSKTRCIDRANLFPEAAAGIRELNIWLGAALAAYAASRRVAGDAAQVDQLQPTPPKPEPQPVAKRNKGGRPLDTAVLTRMRGALKLRDGEWQLVKNGQVVARKNYRDEYGKSIRTIDSYLKLLRSDMQQLD
jgi:hypothetical protein